MSALDHVLDAQASNDLQALRLFNASEEVDSLLEYIELSDCSEQWKRTLRGCALHVLQLNDQERDFERRASALLDAMVPASRAGRMTVPQVARRLRVPLRSSREAARIAVTALWHDPSCGEEVLRARSLRGQLGCRQLALLEVLLGELGGDRS